ncbi:MAG: SAM-dependent methyltransferase, partial [Lachnospiraceae bacterium]
LLHTDFINMAHLGARAFEEIGGEVVQTTSFVMRKSHTKDYKGTYARLVDYNSQQGKEEAFLAKNDLHIAQQENFKKIPGSPIAYWVSENVLNCYTGRIIYDIAKPCKGIDTGNNDIFLRMWHEVSCVKQFVPKEQPVKKLDFQIKKWFPYNKGGEFRKWYGNNLYLLNWQDNGEYLKNCSGSNLRNKEFYFIPGITWSTVTSGNNSFRFFNFGFLFDNGGSCLFSQNNLLFLQGLLNSAVCKKLLQIQPTLNTQPGTIGTLPIIETSRQTEIDNIVSQNISLSKADWDSFETSWDFVCHPLLCYGISLYSGLGDGKNPPTSEMDVVKSETSFRIYERNAPKAYTLRTAFDMWSEACNDRFNTLKSNEEELNRIFIDIYGLQDELTPEVQDKDVTVRKADLQRDIKSLISYAVGCMFGRYSLDVDGLAYAGGDFDTKYCRWVSLLGDEATENIDENGSLIEGGGWAGCSLWEYDGIRKNNKWVLASFKPDTDNIIPITDEEYFEDDIVGRFVKFIKIVYGEETLEENLDFIARTLGGKGNTSRNVIREYFISDKGFYADHCKMYQKRPIYWLFDSGKANGFKALIYMHRYQPDIIARMRTDYVHEQQGRYRTEITDLEKRIAEASSSEYVGLNKQLSKLQDQSEELYKYEEKIHHLADRMIAIDLDDGVKHNYEIFKDVLAKIK